MEKRWFDLVINPRLFFKENGIDFYQYLIIGFGMILISGLIEALFISTGINSVEIGLIQGEFSQLHSGLLYGLLHFGGVSAWLICFSVCSEFASRLFSRGRLTDIIGVWSIAAVVYPFVSIARQIPEIGYTLTFLIGAFVQINIQMRGLQEIKDLSFVKASLSWFLGLIGTGILIAILIFTILFGMNFTLF